MRAKMQLQAITVHPAPGDEQERPFLLVRVAVDCDSCGQDELFVLGHHLKPLIELLQFVVDHSDPALVDAGESTVEYRRAYTLGGPQMGDPRNN